MDDIVITRNQHDIFTEIDEKCHFFVRHSHFVWVRKMLVTFRK